MAFKLLILLILANGAPIIARRIFGVRFSKAIDKGRKGPDGYYLLGPSKTWRGVIAAVILSALAAPVLGIPVLHGAAIGALVMIGDVLASFTKRRLGLPPSSQALGLDQIPESLLPLLVFAPIYHLNWLTIVVLVVAFMMLELLISQLLFRLGIRRHPY